MSPPDAAALLENIHIVLVTPQHPGNIGAAARALRTMGLANLTLVRPERYPHPQTRAQAAGAVAILERARVVDSLDQAIAGCGWVVGTSARPRHLGDEPLLPWEMAPRALGFAAHAPVAIVFGGERSGLSNEDLERCNAQVIIPASAEYGSLNLSHAVQILCYELRRVAVAAPKVSHKEGLPWYAPPEAQEMERFYEHLERVLLSTGFLDPANPRVLMRRLRQYFSRTLPDRNELNILRGILKSVEKPKKRRVPFPDEGEAEGKA
jgi:TrmH family RNA methyltransferase